MGSNVKCNCGGEMIHHAGFTPDADYVECDKCGERVYVNEKQW